MLRAMTRTAHEIADAVRGGAGAEREVAAALRRADRAAPLHALLESAGERARERARGLDEAVARGDRVGPLAGVPIVVKDNLCVEGLHATAGSRSLEGFVPPYTATTVERLERAGAVVVAKANLDEFGMGSTNETSAFGPVLNPWNDGRVAGGSSGGSAAAVAAGVVPVALGTDTGGSVRLPAAFCGVLGFKPTYGALSRYGVIAYASSLDQVGVLARSARDVALAVGAMLGPDPRDATSLALDGAPLALLAAATDGAAGLAGVRVGLVRELAGDGNAPAVRAGLERTVRALEGAGAEIVDVAVPSVRYAVATYYLVATAEASSNLARYDGMIYSRRVGADGDGQERVMSASRGSTLGAEVRRRVLMGSFALSAGYYDAYYGKALKVRSVIARELASAFEGADVLLTPTVPSTAYALGEKQGDPLAMYLGDVCTCLANLAGLPAISVPAGRSDDGLPVGMQFLAPALQDATVLRVAAALEALAGDAFAPVPPGFA